MVHPISAQSRSIKIGKYSYSHPLFIKLPHQLLRFLFWRVGISVPHKGLGLSLKDVTARSMTSARGASSQRPMQTAMVTLKECKKEMGMIEMWTIKVWALIYLSWHDVFQNISSFIWIIIVMSHDLKQTGNRGIGEKSSCPNNSWWFVSCIGPFFLPLKMRWGGLQSRGMVPNERNWIETCRCKPV